MDHTYFEQNLPHILGRLAVRCKVWLDTDTKELLCEQGLLLEVSPVELTI